MIYHLNIFSVEGGDNKKKNAEVLPTLLLNLIHTDLRLFSDLVKYFRLIQ